MDFGSTFEALIHNELVRERFLGSLALLVTVLILRSAAVRAVATFRWRSDAARLVWHQRVRHLAFTVLVLGLVIIWATQLRSLALSAVAIAAAVVLATRELLLCFSGSFLRAATEAYGVGDRIVIGDVHGIVISYGPLGTTLLETGVSHQRTGRTVTVPNSRLLSEHVINETTTHSYVLHILAVPLPSDSDWHQAERRLLHIAEEVCAEHIAPTREHMDRASERYGLPRVDVRPTVTLQLRSDGDDGRMVLHLRFPCMAHNRGQVEQAILRRFFDPQPD
jgi:small-conductance mechanosensitive channel